MRKKVLYKIFFIIISTIVLTGCFVKNDTSKLKNTPEHHSDSFQKNCKKHTEVMEYAFYYIVDEFNKGYFKHKDILGAKAQLYLIENNSQSIFAKNINKAIDSYKLHYKLAKKEKCDLRGFSISPINKIKMKIKKLQKASRNTLQ